MGREGESYVFISVYSCTRLVVKVNTNNNMRLCMCIEQPSADADKIGFWLATDKCFIFFFLNRGILMKIVTLNEASCTIYLFIHAPHFYQATSKVEFFSLECFYYKSSYSSWDYFYWISSTWQACILDAYLYSCKVYKLVNKIHW